MNEETRKRCRDLIKFMETCGFHAIDSIAIDEDGNEYVGTEMFGSQGTWWREIEVEGSGFAQLFKGKIYAAFTGRNR